MTATLPSGLPLLDILLVALRSVRNGAASGWLEEKTRADEIEALTLFCALLPDIEEPRDGPTFGGVRFRTGVTDEQIAAAASTRNVTLTPALTREVRSMEFAVLALLQPDPVPVSVDQEHRP